MPIFKIPLCKRCGFVQNFACTTWLAFATSFHLSCEAGDCFLQRQLKQKIGKFRQKCSVEVLQRKECLAQCFGVVLFSLCIVLTMQFLLAEVLLFANYVGFEHGKSDCFFATAII